MIKYTLIFLLLLSPAWGQQEEDDLEKTIDSTALELAEPMKDMENATKGDGTVLDSEYVQKIVGDKAKKMILGYIKSNPFSKMEYDQIKDHILTTVKDKPAEKLFKKYPKLLHTLILLLRDPNALPAFLGIINKPKELRNYGIAVLVVFILSFALNLLNSKGNLFMRISKKLMIMVGSLTLNFGLFYVFFKPEVEPGLKIIIQNLF